jgi:signal recognition particle subunit SRP54
MAKGKFDLEDYAAQLKQIAKMGSLSGIMGMLPGVGKIKKQLEEANLETTVFKRQAAIIGSMTKAERKNPEILKASRKKRVAAGSGTTVQDVNKLLKQFDDMSTMMKRMNKMGGQAAMLRQMQAAMGGQSGAPQIGGPRGGRRPF